MLQTKANRKRPRRVYVYLTEKEYQDVKAKAKISGLSIGEYTRRLYAGEQIVTAPTDDVIVLIREVKRVGSNLNQLLRRLNSYGLVHGPELDNCIEDTQGAIDLIFRTYRPGSGGD